MDSSYSSRFSKVILTSLFAGIITTLLCLGYDIFYREQTSFSLSEIINVSSLIFIVNLIFLVLGLVYYGFILAFKKGDLLYILALLLFTAFVVVRASHVHRSDDQLLNSEFQHLLTAIVIIIGLAASLGIPYLFHSKKFEEHVL